MSENIVILGGTSAIALAYARDAASEGHRIILVGRNGHRLSENAADLRARGAEDAHVVVADLSDTVAIVDSWAAIKGSAESIDRVLLAYGTLGNQEKSQLDLDYLAGQLRTNFTSAALWIEAAMTHFSDAGSGQLTVIGSVAGDRGRQSNYHYGAAKGALEIFMDGLAHRVAKIGDHEIQTLIVKPGFVDTPMTDHLEKGGPLWASPETIASIIRKAEIRGLRKVYAPWFWRVILGIIKATPFPIFKRTNL